MLCNICPRHCNLDINQIGFCRARKNSGDYIFPVNYGKISSIALDPIEKKPLFHFYPGSHILSVGSFGCNLFCPFCQNFKISMATCFSPAQDISPRQLLNLALHICSNIGVAFTYNEPFISYEFVFDCAKLLKSADLKSVVVTNGFICQQPLLNILPFIDAMNIDLKAFNNDAYKFLGGNLDTVKNTIATAAKFCHVEVTTLIVPGFNDSEDDMFNESKWLASVSDEIPLHVSRFFPRYKFNDRQPTDIGTVYKLADIARQNLKFVYTGNC